MRTTYRGYSVEVVGEGSSWRASAWPMTRDLPILAMSLFRGATSEALALSKVKERIDRRLAECRRETEESIIDNQLGGKGLTSFQ
jgi:hypothetical protein